MALNSVSQTPLDQVKYGFEAFESTFAAISIKKGVLKSKTHDVGSYSKSDYEYTISQALNSLKKLYVFGTKHKERIDFCWPGNEDIWAFKDIIKARLEAISWKRRSNGTRIGAI